MAAPGGRNPLLRAAPGALVLVGLALPCATADAQAAARSRWWNEVGKVERLLEAARWSKAVRKAGELRAQVVGRSWHDPDLGEVLAEIAFLAAVARAELGEDEAAVWEWHVALNHQRMRGRSDLAERDLSPYGRAAGLLAAHPLRRPGEAPPGHEPVAPRPDRDYEPPVVPEGFTPRPLVNTAAARERPAPVLLEVLIDREGRLRQPVVTSTWSHPVMVQWALDNLRRSSPYRPARMEGEPVAVLERLEIHLGDPARGASRRR